MIPSTLGDEEIHISDKRMEDLIPIDSVFIDTSKENKIILVIEIK